jgi:polysaccharide pyruvyl transferase CsaB
VVENQIINSKPKAQRVQPLRRLCIAGWYGYYNIGDEALMEAILDDVRCHLPSTQTVVLSLDPVHTAARHRVSSAPLLPQGIKALMKSLVTLGLFRTMRAIASADAFVLGGGGYLSDWQWQALPYWLGQLAFAKVLGKRTMLYANGAGPIRSRFGKWLTRIVLNRFTDVISVRDDVSAEWLRNAGVTRRIHVTADPVAGKRFELGELPPMVEPGHNVAICVAPLFHRPDLWQNAADRYVRYVKALRKLIQALQEWGVHVHLLPMQPDYDLPFMRDVRKGISDVNVVEDSLTVAQIQALVGQMDVVVGMRLHACVLSANSGTPVVGIIYHHKVQQFLAAAGLDHLAVEIGDGSNWRDSDIDEDRLVENVLYALENNAEIRTKLSARMDIIRNQRERTISLLKEM